MADRWLITAALALNLAGTACFQIPAGTLPRAYADARVDRLGAGGGGRRCAPLQRSGARLRGAPRMSGQGFEDGVPGSWSLEASLDDGDLTGFLNLGSDRTVSAPGAGKESGGNVFPEERATWKIKGLELTVELGRLPGATSKFFDKSFVGKLDPETMLVSGSVLHGDYEPEFVGRFSMKQVMRSGAIFMGEDEEIPPPPPMPMPGPVEDGEWDGEVNEEAWFDDE